jgi:hypothetical protein
LATLYAEASALRNAGTIAPDRLRALKASVANHPDEWLLRLELEELEALT